MQTLVAGQLTSLNSYIWRVLAPNPSPLTGPGTNTYLLENPSGLTVLDPGPNEPSHIDALVKAAEELGGSITQIIVTHTHTDHSPGTQGLLEVYPEAELLGPNVPDDGLQDTLWTPHQLLKDGDKIKLNNEAHLRVIATPGHVGNHLCFLHEPSQVLFTGDHLIDGSTVVIAPPSGSMSAYLHSLEKLQAEDISCLYPGHGNVIEESQQYIQAIMEHRLKREAKVAEALQQNQGKTLEELVVFAYDDTPSYLHKIAEYSLWAHLLKLVEDGRAAQYEKKWWPAN